MEKYFLKVLYPDYHNSIIFTDKERGLPFLTRKEVRYENKVILRGLSNH